MGGCRVCYGIDIVKFWNTNHGMVNDRKPVKGKHGVLSIRPR